jgi:acyl carrier protein
MNRKEAYSKIMEIMKEALKERIDPGGINEHTNLINEIGLNSLEGLEILVRIENEFQIEIDDEDLSIDLMSTISNLMDYVEERLVG